MTMVGGLTKTCAIAATLIGLWAVAQPAAIAGGPEASYAAVGAQTSVPYGWVDFCHRYEGECEGGATEPLDVHLSAKALREINKVNVWVNTHVEPVSDMDHWGVVDQWDYPSDGRGDGEDYALLKRKMLADMGFPRQALLMTVVRDHNGEGHAILTVKTDGGEFVLDNLSDAMLPWKETGYRFVKRQSQRDQNVWLQLGDPTDAPLYTAR
jgi:predicted transglutaminase-like cysteine proteinase